MASQLPFAINQGIAGYPVTSGNLIFGAQDSHKDFVTPMARFEFFDAFASEKSSAAIVFIRMGGTFQTALSNGYQETQSIFGQPNSEGTISGALGNAAKGGLDALYKQLVGAGAGAAGFISSAGLSGKAQYEFMTRKVLNTFQQLIYQGPTFRRFTLPFSMKPTSMQEAEKMVQIIQSFRIASSPKGAGFKFAETINSNDSDAAIAKRATEPPPPAGEAAPTPTGFTQTEINDLFGGSNNGAVALDDGARSTASNFSFGYPDMCKFQILLQRSPNGADAGLAEVFASEYCVIENVQVDYGSQNKMVFFSTTSGGKYYPSEVTLTIGLRETTLPTADFMSTNHTSTERTIF